MKRFIWGMLLVAVFVNRAGAWDGIRPTPEEVAAYRYLEVLRQLAGEPSVIGDIRTQEINGHGEAPVPSRPAKPAERVVPSDDQGSALEKASCKTMKDYLRRTFPLVDCYTLDNAGRVVAEIYGSTPMNHEQEPHFVRSFNGGTGRIYVEHPGPGSMVENRTVDISMPVLDGAKTIGVLVATLLLDK